MLEYLLSMYEALGLMPRTAKIDKLVGHICVGLHISFLLLYAITTNLVA